MTLTHTARAALLLLGALLACAGCSGTGTPEPVTTSRSPAATSTFSPTTTSTASTSEPEPSPTSSSVTVIPEPPPPTPVLRLAKELVGSWETQHWLDSTGSRAIVRTYRFAADGRYEYTLAQCESSTNCVIRSGERGAAQAADGVLSLYPETASADGPRSYPYAVGRDPNVGDLQLHLRLENGDVDIFYAA
jgi:hypothetical protein